MKTRHTSLMIVLCLLLIILSDKSFAITGLDSTFGNGGWVESSFTPRLTYIPQQLDTSKISLRQSDGKIVMVGTTCQFWTTYCGKVDVGLVRYNTDGTLDNTFDNDGKVVTTFPSIGSSSSSTVSSSLNAIIQQNDNKLVVAGKAGGKIALARYQPNGKLDGSFGIGGRKIEPIFGEANKVFQLNDGSLLVIGSSNNQIIFLKYTSSGVLDLNFGVNGKILQSENGTVSDALQLSDGTFAVLRTDIRYTNGTYTVLNNGFVSYNSDGTLNTNFGSAGVVDLPGFSGTMLPLGNNIIQLTPSDKLVVVGKSCITPNYSYYVSSNIGSVYSCANQKIYAARFNANGKLDTDFNLIGFNEITATPGVSRDAGYFAMSDGSDNFLVSASTCTASYGGCDSYSPQYVAILRFNANGVLDSSFGIGGIITGPSVTGATQLVDKNGGYYVIAGNKFDVFKFNSTGVSDNSFGINGTMTTLLSSVGGIETGLAITQQINGKLLVAADSVNISIGFYPCNIVRYNLDGSLDKSFSGTGNVNSTIKCNSIIQQSDGKIIAGGRLGSNGFYRGINFALARYNIDGSIDNGFANNGLLNDDAGHYFDSSYYSNWLNKVIQQQDGKLVIAGSMSNSNFSGFAVARYNLDGTKDTSFGANGVVNTTIDNLGTETVEVANDIIQQHDGKLVIVGSTCVSLLNSECSNFNFAILRYNTNGTLDTTFNGTGKLTTDFNMDDYAVAVTQQSDGKLVVVGSTCYPTKCGTGPSDIAIARYTANGKLDSTFGVGGKRTLKINNNNFNSGYAVAQQTDDYLIVAFNLGYSKTGIVCLNNDGSICTSFGDNGVSIFDIGFAATGYGFVQQTDRNLAVVGQFHDLIDSNTSLVLLARFNAPASTVTPTPIGAPTTTNTPTSTATTTHTSTPTIVVSTASTTPTPITTYTTTSTSTNTPTPTSTTTTTHTSTPTTVVSTVSPTPTATDTTTSTPTPVATIIPSTEMVLIRAKASKGGVIIPSGNISAAKGSQVTFEIMPSVAAQYEISDVKVDGISQGVITSYTFNDVAVKHKIQATFKVRSYNITVTNEQPEFGKLNFTGVKSLRYGKFLTVKATPLTTIGTAEISVDGQVVINGLPGKTTSYKLFVDSGHMISVRFLNQQ